MKIKALALGITVALPIMAHAQSGTDVTLYGIVDTAIEYLNNIPEFATTINGSGQRVVNYNNQTGQHNSVHFTNLTSSVPSMWGVRGRENLGNGMSAIFTLESGFNPGTGTSNQGGRLFGRQAFVGLKGDWGQIAFGRQYNMLMRGMMYADVLGPNAQGMASLDAYLANARMDNAIAYTGSFNGIRVGAAYARGRDTMNGNNPAATGCGVDYTDQSACTAWNIMAGYDTAIWGIAAAYDVIRGQGDGTTTNPTTNYYHLTSAEEDRRWTINGYIKFGTLKIGLLYLNRKNEAGLASYAGSLGNRSDLWTLNASYQVTPAITLDGAVNYIRYKDANESSNSWYYVARAMYSLSKRTAIYTTAAYIKNNGLAANSAAGGTAGMGPMASAGGNQISVVMGLRHSF